MRDTKETTENREALLKFLTPGDTVYTMTRHVSRSGMMRRISVFIARDNRIVDLDWHIAKTGLFKRHKSKEGLIVGGCGMDMHFHVIHTLGRYLYPNGFQKEDTYLDRKPTYQHEPDGGYAFHKESL